MNARAGTLFSRERLTGNWIDDVARSLTRGVGKRRALAVAGSGLAALIGRDPTIAGCKSVGKKCAKNTDRVQSDHPYCVGINGVIDRETGESTPFLPGFRGPFVEAVRVFIVR